ncbi:DUF4386 domain-containing protein [Pseudalkalibacillus hwajinpoensis]|uniref:DUF4386 domain-containing protein n=1 Tax=Guptibacillus hwajinpoensis TaxID=208199 RepID=UPI001CD7E455|nr:DUF4386 domain-containing protein [Pseudalkalibacillus hwajinpoensis]MCA0991907.1 DUF4386 domain-containing protein [Pseudalkalibacillus hwajinpoensis]
MELKTTTNQNMQQKAAVFSAIALLIMTFAAVFAQGYVHSSLVVEGDAATTLKNIQASQGLFRLEVLGWLIIIILDLIVSWGFYLFLKPFHAGYALLAGGLRFLYTVILAIAVSHLVITNSVVQNAELGTSSDTVAQQVMDAITAFEAIWSFGLIIFGLHLIVVGMVAWKTTRIPKVISFLVVLAGFSYSLIHFIYQFIPQLENVTGLLELILMVPMVIGELGFGIWLLVKGRKVTMD